MAMAMAMVPLYMMVHSQVAVLLPVGGEAHPMCFNTLEIRLEHFFPITGGCSEGLGAF